MLHRDGRQSSKTRFTRSLLRSTLLSLLAGCATGPHLAGPNEMGIAERVHIEGVPFHAQGDHQCGPASLAMVLNASGVEVGMEELTPQVFLPGRKGSVQPEMQAVPRRYGRISFALDGSFQSLLSELDAGQPVVVMQNLSLPVLPMWHYAVAIGYDLAERRITLHSGEQPDRRVSFQRFDTTWARSNRWALVVLAPGEPLPVSLRPYRAMDAILAFERANSADEALPAWRSVVARWPEFAMGWFALGNAEHVAGHAREAVSAFREATQHDPEMAAAWLNLGLLLEEAGDLDEARQALGEAASLPSQWQETARQALVRIGE